MERGEITNLGRNISWAEVYRDAGWVIEAAEAFRDAMEQAYQENDAVSFHYCSGEIHKIPNPKSEI